MRVRRLGGCLVRHPTELAFGVVTAAWSVYLLRLTGGFYFGSDDLRLIEQGGEVAGLLRPYNGHLSVIILALYRVAADVGGLAYGPYTAVGAACLVAVPIAYFATTRRTLGPALASIMGMPLLWGAVSLRPSSLNNHLALVGAIVCAAALGRGARGDRLLAVALVFSLSSAGGGVVVVLACLIHNLLTRARRGRWLAVLVPAGLWGAWWWLMADHDTVDARLPLRWGERAQTLSELLLAPFENVAFGITGVAVVLAAAFLLYGALLCSRGLDQAANLVAWSAAMLLWSAALIHSRGVFADASVARYTYPTLVFGLLALVPRQPIRGSGRFEFLHDRRWAPVASVVVLALAAARAAEATGALSAAAERQTAAGRDARGTTLVVHQAPAAIDPDTPLRFYGSFDWGTVADLRSLIDRYGLPSSTSGSLERQLIDLEVIQVERFGERAAACETPFDEILLEPGRVRLWSAEASVVEVRRYDDRWTRLLSALPGEVIVVTLPSLYSNADWRIRWEGVCRG